MPDAPIAFFSYSREDSEFALRLANDLRAAGSAVWIDQLDIGPGERWDRVVQSALENCPSVLVILSPASVNSNNVLDEVSFALDQNKTLIPVLYRECDIPFRLRRFQHVDFRGDYDRMLQELRKCLHIDQPALQQAASSIPVQTLPSLRKPIPAEVQRVTPPPVAPVRAPEPQRISSSDNTPSSVIPAWAKYGIPLAIVLIAVVIYLMTGSHSTQRGDTSRGLGGPTAGGSGNQAGAALGNVELETALAKAQTSPPCSLPTTNDLKYVAADPSVWFFFSYRRANPEDQWSVDWVEPNGYVHKTNNVAHPSPAGHYCFEMKIAGSPAQNAPGMWTVRLNRNGSAVAEKKFAIFR